MNSQFRRILELVRRTGDRVVVTDPNGQDAYVVMGLDQYEGLIDSIDYFSESEEYWADENIDEYSDSSNVSVADYGASDSAGIWDTMKSAGDTGETWDIEKMTEDEQGEVKEVFEQAKEIKKSVSEVENPADQQKNAETSEKLEEASGQAKDVSGSEEEGIPSDQSDEEQFYLEPVE